MISRYVIVQVSSPHDLKVCHCTGVIWCHGDLLISVAQSLNVCIYAIAAFWTEIALSEKCRPMDTFTYFWLHSPRAGSRVVIIVPLCFLAGCHKRRLKQGSVCLSVSIVFVYLLFIKTTFCVLLVYVGICCVFWLFWINCHYLPSDWLERLLWGSLAVARGSSPQSPGWRAFMTFCLM